MGNSVRNHSKSYSRVMMAYQLNSIEVVFCSEFQHGKGPGLIRSGLEHVRVEEFIVEALFFVIPQRPK